MRADSDREALPPAPRVVVAIPAVSPDTGYSGARTTAELVSDLERVPGLDEQTRSSLADTLVENAAVFDRWLEVHRRPTPMLALHPGPLPDGAAALLVRDPGSEPHRLIVFSEAALDDPLLDRALSEFSADEFEVSELSGRRVMAVARDAHDLDPSGAPFDDLARVTVGDKSLARTDALRHRTPELPHVDVPGLGRVRVLLASQDLPLDWDVLLGSRTEA